jgi:hypothetical protein
VKKERKNLNGTSLGEKRKKEKKLKNLDSRA